MRDIFLVFNTILFFYLIYYSITNLRKSIILSLSIFTFSLMYTIGFLSIITYPNIFAHGYLHPNYDLNYIFAIPKDNAPLYALTTVQVGLFLGLILVRKFSFTAKITLKDLIYINKPYSLYFGMLLLIVTYLYFILFFYDNPSWPLLYYLKYGSSPAKSCFIWGSVQADKPFFFYISLMRQFLQVLMPLAGFYLITYYWQVRSYLVLIIVLLHFSIFFILIAGFLKSTPVLLFFIELFIFGFIQKKINKKIIILSIILGCGGYYANMAVRYLYNYTTSNSATTKTNLDQKNNSLYVEEKSHEVKEKNYKRYEKFSKYCFDYFKNGKVRVDFSPEGQEKLKQFNKKSLTITFDPTVKAPYSNFVAKLIGRVLVGEMMNTFMIVGNDELRAYYKENEPLIGYVKKVVGLNNMTIYQQLAKIMNGDLSSGSLTISFFFEIYLLCGVSSILIIALYVLSLSCLDRVIFNRGSNMTSENEQSFIDPSFVFLVAIIPMMGLKGFMASFFTGGCLTILLWLSFKTLLTLYIRKMASQR
jgi:hypothetical protein